MLRNKIVAHRGASTLARENTLVAFSKAIELGCGGIELDVRRTGDDQLICFHDLTISGKKISELTYVEVNRLANKQSFSVPTLAESLKLIKNKATVYIEIKEKGYELSVVEQINKILSETEFAIISFNFSSLRAIKKSFPNIKLGLILGLYKSEIIDAIFFLVLRSLVLSNVNFLVLNYKILESSLHRMITSEIPYTVWTVDNMELVKKYLKDDKIIGVTTNIPQEAIKLL